MKIECPVINREQAQDLLQAGADILYASIAPNLLSPSSIVPISRRPWNNCNIQTMFELKQICTFIEQKKKKFYLCLNEHYYPQDIIESIIVFLKNNDYIKNIIVSELGLILAIREVLPEINIIASVGTNIFNLESFDFYSQLGLKEITLPRELETNNIKKFHKKSPKINLSCLIKNDDCPNIDGLCNYSHGFYDPAGACVDLYNISILSKEPGTKGIVNRIDNYNYLTRQNCRLCQLKALKNAGVNIIKIAGRGASTNYLIKNIKIVKWALKNINLSLVQYTQAIQEKYFEIFKVKCALCYKTEKLG